MMAHNPSAMGEFFKHWGWGWALSALAAFFATIATDVIRVSCLMIFVVMATISFHNTIGSRIRKRTAAAGTVFSIIAVMMFHGARYFDRQRESVAKATDTPTRVLTADEIAQAVTDKLPKGLAVKIQPEVTATVTSATKPASRVPDAAPVSTLCSKELKSELTLQETRNPQNPIEGILKIHTKGFPSDMKFVRVRTKGAIKSVLVMGKKNEDRSMALNGTGIPWRSFMPKIMDRELFDIELEDGKQFAAAGEIYVQIFATDSFAIKCVQAGPIDPDYSFLDKKPKQR
jgi:hypothetical protein